MHWFKALLCLLAIPLFIWSHNKLSRPNQLRLFSLIILVGVLAYFQFGLLHQNGTYLHKHEMFHYALNSKHFDDLGYFKLYQCTARVLLENGDGQELVRYRIRDLESNNLKRGRWALTKEGACPMQFNTASEKQFKQDILAFRDLYGLPVLARAIGDHGYNATPINTVWLKIWSSWIDVTHTQLQWLTQIDTVALIVILAAIHWGFGLRVCAVAALLLGLGYPWQYDWTGGGFSRLTWLAFLCIGMASLKRERYLLAGSSITISGLLTLFPLVFAGSLITAIVIQAIKRRQLDLMGKQLLISIAATFVIIVLVVGFVLGFDSYADFYLVMSRHTGTPLVNHMGLSTLLGWEPGFTAESLIDQKLDDPFLTWKEHYHQLQHERVWIWITAIALSIITYLLLLRRNLPIWYFIPLAGPTLFSAVAMTSYYYIWMIVLVPLIANNSRQLTMLFSFLFYTQVVAILQPGLQQEHLLHSAGALLFFISLSIDMLVTRDNKTNIRVNHSP